MHIKVTDADVFQMISDVDEDNSGAIGVYHSLIFNFCAMECLVPFCGFVHTRKKMKIANNLLRDEMLCAVLEFQEFLRVMENQKIAESNGEGEEICKSLPTNYFIIALI